MSTSPRLTCLKEAAVAAIPGFGKSGKWKVEIGKWKALRGYSSLVKAANVLMTRSCMSAPRLANSSWARSLSGHSQQ